MKGLIDQSAQLSNNLNILSTTTGVDPQYIQKLEHAAYVLGSSKQAADQWIASLSALQQKLTVAQGDQRFFTAAQMLGVDPVSFQKIIGNTEDLEKAVRKILTKQWSPSDRISQEQFARTKTWLASLINMPTDLLTAIQNPDFQKQFDSFAGLTNAEIKQNIASTEAWRSLVDKVNIKFMEIADQALPHLTAAVNAFVTGGGMKDLFTFVDDIAKVLNFSAKGWGMILHPENLVDMQKEALQRQKSDLVANQYKRELMKLFPDETNIPAGQRNAHGNIGGRTANITVNVPSITIKTDNPQEFGKKFQDEFTKALDLATRQSPLGQT
ncbi:unnamed protein product [Sphagnum balticum]